MRRLKTFSCLPTSADSSSVFPIGNPCVKLHQPCNLRRQTVRYIKWGSNEDKVVLVGEIFRKRINGAFSPYSFLSFVRRKKRLQPLETSVIWGTDVEWRIESVTGRRQNDAQVWNCISVCSKNLALNILGLFRPRVTSAPYCAACSLDFCCWPIFFYCLCTLFWFRLKVDFSPFDFLSPSGFLVMAVRDSLKEKSTRSAFPGCLVWAWAGDFPFLGLGNS